MEQEPERPSISERIDPKEFNLPARTVLEKHAGETIALVVDRKSRIIMSDGKKILDKANKIRETKPEMQIVLKTSAPVCSKTKKFLVENSVDIIKFP